MAARLWLDMLVLPKRTSLITQTAESLKKMIVDGDLSGTLPGEFPLKASLGVGRDTLRLSLKQLEQEGWLSAAGRGRQRVIKYQQLPVQNREQQSRLPVTFLSPFPVVDRITLLELDELRQHLAQQGRELRFVCSSQLHTERPERHLKRVVAQNPSGAWVLHWVGEHTQRWFLQQAVPAIVYGSVFTGINLPFVVNDWESAAFHAGVELTRHGHRTLALLAFETRMPGALHIERGLRRALATVGAPTRLMVFTETGSPQAIAQALDKIFQLSIRPTALVLCSSSQLLTCFAWIASKGIAVPDMVSLICIPRDIWFEDLYPPVCHYENNPKIFARLFCQKVIELLETGHVARGGTSVRLNYKRGATIGAAKITS